MAPSACTAENCEALPRFPFSSPIALLSVEGLQDTFWAAVLAWRWRKSISVVGEACPAFVDVVVAAGAAEQFCPRCTELVYAKRPVRNGGKSACVNELEDQAVDERRRSPIVLEHQRNKKVVEERWLDWCSFTPRAGCSTFPA